MKRLMVVLVAILLLSGCGHTHNWIEADCENPQTCSECGETEGEALGHKWVEADCENPKTCSECGKTEGDALGHKWVEADCENPKTCSECGKTEGEALGHDTPELTCTTDATCTRCHKTIPAPGHNFSDATCTEPATCSVCGATEGEALGHTTDRGTCERCGQEIYETVYGRGDDVVSEISLGTGIYRIHFTHSGVRNFVVWSYDATDDKELLVNEIGNYDGTVLLNGRSPYSFEITADGEWSYTIEPIGESEVESFAGRGDYVSDKCSLHSGVWQFTHDGDSNFVVKLYTTDGRSLLINEIGVYSGKKKITIPEGSFAILEVNADGNWTIEEAS